MRVLVTGIAGAVGRRVARELVAAGHEVAGIDRRGWIGAPPEVELHELDIRKRTADTVFRRFRPEGVVHLATVTHVTAPSDDRYRINLYGTRAVFDHSSRYGVRRVIFVGRHTYYGAGPDAPLYHREDEPPLAVATFPELADLVAADLYAGSALWRFPGMETAILRICYTLGPSGLGPLASYLRGPRVPSVLGYDPLFQYIHEDDAAAAIALALTGAPRGVFNVAGPRPMPLSLLIALVGRRRLPLPEPLFRASLGRFGLPALPRDAVAHIKYPVVVADEQFRRHTGFSPRYDEDETAAAFRAAPERPDAGRVRGGGRTGL